MFYSSRHVFYCFLQSSYIVYIRCNKFAITPLGSHLLLQENWWNVSRLFVEIIILLLRRKRKQFHCGLFFHSKLFCEHIVTVLPSVSITCGGKSPLAVVFLICSNIVRSRFRWLSADESSETSCLFSFCLFNGIIEKIPPQRFCGQDYF